MVKVNSVFHINGENYEVTGTGQLATSAIIKQFPGQRIVLVGFKIGDLFHRIEW